MGVVLKHCLLLDSANQVWLQGSHDELEAGLRSLEGWEAGGRNFYTIFHSFPMLLFALLGSEAEL